VLLVNYFRVLISLIIEVDVFSILLWLQINKALKFEFASVI